MTTRELVKECVYTDGSKTHVRDAEFVSSTGNVMVSIFWHSRWYPIVETYVGAGLDLLYGHREFGENPDCWADSINQYLEKADLNYYTDWEEVKGE